MVDKNFNDYKELIKKNKLDNSKNEEIKNTTVSIGVIVFCLENEYYCIEVEHVKEIIEVKKFTRLPNSYPYIKGLINLRGDIIPIVDLKKMFNSSIPDNDKLLRFSIIIKIDEFIIGVLVNRIIGIVLLNLEDIKSSSHLFGFINEKYIKGVIEMQNYVTVLLNIRKIFEVNQKDLNNSSVLSSEETFYKDIPKMEDFSGFFIHSVNIDGIKENYLKYKLTKKQNVLDSQFSNLIFQKFLSKHTNEITKKPYSDYYIDVIRSGLKKYPFGKIKIMILGSRNGYEAYSIYTLTSDYFPNADVYMTSYIQNNQDIYSSQNFILTEKEIAALGVDKGRYFTPIENNKFEIKEEIKNKIKFELYNDIENDNDLFDIIIAKDISITMNEIDYRKIIEKIVNKNLIVNGLFIIGDNEKLLDGLNLISDYDNKINTFTKN